MIFLIVAVCLILTAQGASLGAAPDESDTLILVHTMFRHGNRTIQDNIYDTNPYGNESFYAPYGYGQLTNEGKKVEYQLGQALRKRYGQFLGPEYSINLIDARSTTSNRTKMSMLLVLASLFPPTEDLEWNHQLLWQPIPYNTFDNDKELKGRKVCQEYKEAFKKIEKSDEVKEEMAKHQEVLDILTEKTGKKIQKAKKVADLYIELLTQNAFGYPPPDWFNAYSEEMFNLTMYSYKLMALKKKVRKFSTGYFLRKIIEDTEYRIKHEDSPTKMFLYAAHEKNIATFLVTLEVFNDQIPTWGSYVTIEAHKIGGVYGFKFFYQNYRDAEPILLKIPGCEEFCALDQFKDIVSTYIPEDDECTLFK